MENVTMDETWIHDYTLHSRLKSTERLEPDSSRPK